MAERSVVLPNGKQISVSFPEGTSDQEIKDYVFNEYVLNRDPGSVIGGALSQGVDNLQQSYGSAVEGAGNYLDSNFLREYGAKVIADQEREIAAQQYNQAQYSSKPETVVGKGYDYVANLAGQSAPQMGTTLAGAAAGAKVGGSLGALTGPLAPILAPTGAVVGAGVGGFLANMPYFYGSNRERQKEAIDRGYRTEIDERAALLGAIPQSALDSVVGMLGAKFFAAPALRANGGIFTRAVKGSIEGSLTEAPTEIGQAVIERYQAGLPLVGQEAFEEYMAAGVGGAVLGGMLGGGGAVLSGPRESNEDVAAGAAARVKEVQRVAGPIMDKLNADRSATVTSAESKALALAADSFKPVDIITQDTITERGILTDAAMKGKLDSGKRDYVGLDKLYNNRTKKKVTLKEGDLVATRLDINGYDKPADGGDPAYIVTFHEAKEGGKSHSAGASLGYGSTAVLKDVTFGVGSGRSGQKAAASIAAGDNKSTLATIRGKFSDVSPEKAVQMLRENLDQPGWTQVGMDPERRGYFYDRKTMQEVTSGDMAIQVGKMILVKNAKKGVTPNNEYFSRGIDTDIVSGASAPAEPKYIFVDPFYGVAATPSMTMDEVREAMREQDLGTWNGPLLDMMNMREYEPPESEIVAGAGSKTTKKKKKKKKKLPKRDYDLLDSPFIRDYSGAKAQDKSVPDYETFHYKVPKVHQKALNAAIESGAIDSLADTVASEAATMMEDPAIAAGIGWYGRMRKRLKVIFGNDVDVFTQLLGTTSAQTPVETNFRYSVDLYNRFKAGEFDAKIKKYLELNEMLKAGDLGDLLLKDKVKNSKGVTYTPEMIKKSEGSALLGSAAKHYNLPPAQTSGKLYGSNSYPALKALAQIWFDERLESGKMTPKTPQFTMNLNGASLEATIDVWAARLLHRVIYNGQPNARLLAEEENAVTNGDFALGQLVFRRAAKKLNMNPDDLQALVWFGEKQIWDTNGWTGAAGALKSSFDVPADVFYPTDGSTRTEEDANFILDFLAKERLVKRNIDFPDAVSEKTQQKTKKEYEKFLTESVIIDYLKSRGSGAVYASGSVQPSGDQQGGGDIVASAAGVAGNRIFNEPIPSATTISERYARSQGLDAREPRRILEINKDLARKIGEAFERMPDDPSNPATKRAYAAMVKEVLAQYDAIIDGGYSMELSESQYSNAQDMLSSVAKEKVMRVFPTSSGFGSTEISAEQASGSPMLQPSGRQDKNGKPLLVNDVFRFVHDFFGHGKLGNGFGPLGEENAWNVHRLMFSPLAQGALTTETRGQNSWVNFSGVNDAAFEIRDRARQLRREGNLEEAQRLSDLAYETMQFADNKIGLLPAEFSESPYQEDITAGAAPEGGSRIDDSPLDSEFSNANELNKFIYDSFEFIARKMGVPIVTNYGIGAGGVRYNVTQGVIEYNPNQVLADGRTKAFMQAAMREEIIHAAMHKVLMKRYPNKSRENAWVDFMTGLGKSMTQAERQAMAGAYVNLDGDMAMGAEYSRAVIQKHLYGNVTEEFNSPSLQKIVNLLKSTQSYIARLFGKDVGTDQEVAAVIRDSANLVKSIDPSARVTNQGVVTEASRLADMADGTQDATSDVVAEAAKPPSKKAGIGFFQKYFYTPSVIMEKIHPRLARLFHNFVNSIDKETLGYMRRVNPFVKKYNAIKSKKDKRRLKTLLYYSPSLEQDADTRNAIIQERNELLRKYGMLEDYVQNVRPVLDEIRAMANDQGMEVSFLDDYFPRRVIDLDSVRKFFGRTVVNDFTSYIESINESRRMETDPKKKKPAIARGSVEEAMEFDKYIRSGEYIKRGVKPRYTKKRSIEMIDDAILDAYADPGEAIENYIHSMVVATKTMKLLGRRYETEGENILFETSGELGAMIQDLLAKGEIDDETAFRTIPQFSRMMLNPVMQENAFLSSLRSFSYLTLLVEFTSTLSNLFDLPFVMYKKGFFPTISAMLSNKQIKLEDIGIDGQQISQEFKGQKNFLAEAVRLGLKSTGFTAMDRILKETNLNANYNYYRNRSRGYLRNRNSKASQELKAELDFLLGEDADAAIAAFAKGDLNNDLVREVVLRKLLETQPLNRMEIPLGQSESANKRILYTMKSFQVKQLNFVVNQMLSKIFSRSTSKAQKAAATRDLAKLMFFMLMVGVPIDALKDLLAGRMGYMSDYVFNGIFRLGGVSRYTAYNIKREGIGEAALDYFSPVGLQQIMDTTGALQDVISGKKAVTDPKLVTLAPHSDVINRMFGFTKDRERRELSRRAAEGELPSFIPPGAL